MSDDYSGGNDNGGGNDSNQSSNSVDNYQQMPDEQPTVIILAPPDEVPGGDAPAWTPTVHEAFPQQPPEAPMDQPSYGGTPTDEPTYGEPGELPAYPVETAPPGYATDDRARIWSAYGPPRRPAAMPPTAAPDAGPVRLDWEGRRLGRWVWDPSLGRYV